MPRILVNEGTGVELSLSEVVYIRASTAEVISGLTGAEQQNVYDRSSVKFGTPDPRDVLPGDADVEIRVDSPSLWALDLSDGQLAEAGTKIEAALGQHYTDAGGRARHFVVFVKPVREGGNLE